MISKKFNFKFPNTKTISVPSMNYFYVKKTF